jgi:glycosyltransferase involved in cell wall biosynthesis
MSRVIECWARILAAAGHEIIVVSEDREERRPLPPIAGVVNALYPPPPRAGRMARLLGGPREALRVMESLETAAPLDAILSHDSVFSVALRRRFPSKPLLQTFHSPTVDEGRLNNWTYAEDWSRRAAYPATFTASWFIDRMALNAISRAHTLSEYTWQLLSRHYPRVCRRTPWVRIPGSFDDERFAPAVDRGAVRRSLGLDEKEIVLLSVRRLVPRNGLERIVGCADSLRDRLGNTRFLVGGSGPLRGALEERIAMRGLGESVQLLGFIPEESLAAYYQAADAFLMPTRDLECFGLPVVEAMGCGATPLVLPDGGPAEICSAHPELIAEENSDEGFTNLVARYLSGEIAGDVAGIAREARKRYAERSLTADVWRAVSELVGSA